MNKFILLFFSLAISLHALQWKTLEEGIKHAKKSNKLIMVDVIRDNCRFCTNMEKNVFDNKEMGQWIEGCFIPVKVNLSKNDTMPKGVSVQITPTFIFLDADEKVIKMIHGSWNIDDFKSLSQDLCKE